MVVSPVLVTVEAPRTAKLSAVPRILASIRRSSRHRNPSDRVRRLLTVVRRVRLQDEDFPNRPVNLWLNIVCPPCLECPALPRTKKADVAKHPAVFRHAGLLVNKPPTKMLGCSLPSHPTTCTQLFRQSRLLEHYGDHGITSIIPACNQADNGHSGGALTQTGGSLSISAKKQQLRFDGSRRGSVPPPNAADHARWSANSFRTSPGVAQRSA